MAKQSKRGGEIKSKCCISAWKPQQTMEILWRYEERRTESNETIYCVFSVRDQTPRYLPLWFCVLKHLYKTFSLQSFSAFLYTLLYHMNYDLPSGNHEKAVLFYIHHTIVLSILYLIVLFQKSIIICFNKDENKILRVIKCWKTSWPVPIGLLWFQCFFNKVKMVSVTFDTKKQDETNWAIYGAPLFSTVTHKNKNLVWIIIWQAYGYNSAAL